MIIFCIFAESITNKLETYDVREGFIICNRA